MSRPYALTIRSPRDQGYDLAERLGFDEATEALAVSVFDDGPDAVSVQALYETKLSAERARTTLSNIFEITISQLPDTDWVGLSQSGLPPIEAGRFMVHGSHDTPELQGRIPIRIDAGQAFGTGHHGTTKGCLLMLTKLQSEGTKPKDILDLGTGAGILAIGAAKLWPDAKLLATDIDPIAIDVARTNAVLNDTAMRTVVADGFKDEVLMGRDFDLVIANILAGPLRGLAADIAAAMRPGATAILSGILDEQADWVAEAFRDCGLTPQPQDSLNGWTSLLAVKA